MEWVVVRFPRVRDVYVGGSRVGRTNRLLTTRAGLQTFHLGDGGGYRPSARRIDVRETLATAPLVVHFEEA